MNLFLSEMGIISLLLSCLQQPIDEQGRVKSLYLGTMTRGPIIPLDSQPRPESNPDVAAGTLSYLSRLLLLKMESRC